MVVTQALIDEVTDPVQKMSLQIQFDNAANLVASTANGTRQANALEANLVEVRKMLALQAQVANGLLSRNQELWTNLYNMHLKARLGPAIITSATADTVMDDLVRDAVRMTQMVYPTILAELNTIG